MEKDMMQKESTSRPKVSLSFELSRSHLFQLLSTKVNVDETVMEEVVKVLEKKSEPVADEADDAVSDAEEPAESEEGTEAEPVKEDGESAAETEAAQEEKEYVEKVVPHVFSVDDIVENLPGLRLMSKEQKKDARQRIKALHQRDKDKMMADEAKNKYEA